MAKGKKIEAEFHLPEAIIQHIQSFLKGKKAAQTTLLSKSWYNAWLTRPNLHFDQQDFERESDDDTVRSANRLSNFVKKILKRYETLNLKIDSLKLSVDDSFDSIHNSYSNASKLILKVLKMGATDLDLDIQWRFAFPQEVFESENLTRLSVSGGKIVIEADRKVRCSRLKSLTLRSVYVENDTIRDIISSCPLIENLELCTCHGLAFSTFTKRNVGSVVDSPFNKLKCLLLSKIDVDTLFFHDFSSKFPCLKDLSLEDCGGYKGIQISSPSLDFISFSQDKMLRVKFDVPNVRKFVFSGPIIPSLSFKTTTSNWESNISISCRRSPSATWFLKLNKLLTKLSLSKVSLDLDVRGKIDCAEDLKGLPKPEVENLTIFGPESPVSIYSAFFDGLFRCCRPIYIYQPWFHSGHVRMRKRDFMNFVYKRVMQEVSLNRRIANQSQCHLEEVNVEYFDGALSAWRSQLLDASTSSRAGKQKMRLYLRWGH